MRSRDEIREAQQPLLANRRTPTEAVWAGLRPSGLAMIHAACRGPLEIEFIRIESRRLRYWSIAHSALDSTNAALSLAVHAPQMIGVPLTLASFLALRDEARSMSQRWHGGLEIGIRKRCCRLLLEAQGGICGICASPISAIAEANLDHVISRDDGGFDGPGNLLAAHRTCNSRKASLAPSVRSLDALEYVNNLLQWGGGPRVVGSSNEAAEVGAIKATIDTMSTFLHVSPRRGPYMQDVIKWRLVADLPDLCDRYPDGVTINEISSHYDIPVPTAQIAVKLLAKAEKIQWVARRGTRFKIALPIGRVVPPLPITNSQQRVIDALRQHDQNEEVEISHNMLSQATGAHPSSVAYVLKILTLRGHIKLIKAGRGGSPSIYRILVMSERQIRSAKAL